MLGTQDRSLLVNIVEPPPGYSFDFAVGTTYSLDLEAMLHIPISFGKASLVHDDKRTNPDPLVLLESLRSQAGKMVIFCQRGGIKAPVRHHRLFTCLEKSLVEVNPPGSKGVFHPKLWALRFVNPEGEVRYRLLCLSRNLTYDRSWDTACVLEGDLLERQNAIARNHPLGDFFASLPAMAHRPVTPGISEMMDRLQREIRRVAWEPLEDFEDLGFHPLGLRGAGGWPFALEGKRRPARLLIVSPFVSNDPLARLAAWSESSILVSRAEELDRLNPKTLERFKEVYCLSPEADPIQEDLDGSVRDESLRGLHAKFYIAEAGWEAKIWTGSANCTHQGLGSEKERGANVEFLTSLKGRKSKIGIDQFLGQGSDRGFSKMLVRYAPPEAPPEDRGEDELALEEVCRLVSSWQLAAEVTPHEGREAFSLRLTLSGNPSIDLPKGVRLLCRPSTLNESSAQEVKPDGERLPFFEELSYEALTPFIAFDAKTQSKRRQFVVQATLVGAPEDRSERLLRDMLKNREQVLRYILLLLQGADGEPAGFAGEGSGSGAARGGAGSFFDGSPLLELLMKTLARAPEKLDAVAGVVRDLEKGDDPENGLPEGFKALWGPLWETRERLRHEQKR